MEKFSTKEILKKLKDPVNGIPLKTRSSILKSYYYTFTGSEIFEFLLKLNYSKDEAYKISNQLLEDGDIKSVFTISYFQNTKNYFYQFKHVNVLVIGGGFAGCRVIKKLQEYGVFDITLVSEKSYFENIPSIPNLVVNNAYFDKMHIKHEKIFKGIKVIYDSVETLEPHKVTLKSQKTLEGFDYLVICSGSTYKMDILNITNSKVINSTSSKDIVANFNDLENAKKVTIIGSGPVGIEVTGEILHKYPNKEITIIASHSVFLDRCCPDAHKNITNYFKKYKNLTILLNERVKEIKDNKIITENHTIESDVTYACIGFKPNTEFMEKNFESCLKKNGTIKVNDFLQMEGYSHIFVGGDVTGIEEEKLAQNAELHAELISKNIERSLCKENLGKYVSSTRPLLISIGPHSSIFVYGQKVMMEGYLISLVKSLVEYKIMNQY